MLECQQKASSTPSYLVALGERELDAGGGLHVVCRCLYRGRGRREGPVLKAVCNALNRATRLLLLGCKYWFLVLHAPLHFTRILQGAKGAFKKKIVKNVLCVLLIFICTERIKSQ